MKKGSAKPSDAVQALLDEKRRIEQWLARIGGAADTTPEHVRAKVRADYERRLDELVRELQEHREQLVTALDAQQQRQRELDEQQRAAAERLAEAELRHSVGEYDDATYSQLKRDIAASLAKARGELETVRAQMETVQEVLAALEAAPAGAGGPDEEEVELGGMQVALDEMPAAPPATRGDAPRKPVRQADAFDELEFLKSVTGSEQAPPAARRASGAAKRPSAPERKARHSGASQIGAEGVESLASESAPPTKGMMAEKTLKCAECGARNLPTEWYCERCGAELAAL